MAEVKAVGLGKQASWVKRAIRIAVFLWLLAIVLALFAKLNLAKKLPSFSLQAERREISVPQETELYITIPRTLKPIEELVIKLSTRDWSKWIVVGNWARYWIDSDSDVEVMGADGKKKIIKPNDETELKTSGQFRLKGTRDGQEAQVTVFAR